MDCPAAHVFQSRQVPLRLLGVGTLLVSVAGVQLTGGVAAHRLADQVLDGAQFLSRGRGAGPGDRGRGEEFRDLLELVAVLGWVGD